MKFLTGFVVGTISGVALHFVQSKDALSSVNDTKIFQNIKDFKDILTDLQKNAAVVPEVVSGIQADLSNYSESIKPDVEELQESIAEMKSNLDELNKD
ncbi:hypothetical protein [Companilactobacillus bobalius]|uniref:YtxH domain-containing protein n=2 Tax=Companilactobacillus bobalius TaxID=2801451 RepID=A0A202F6V4_9LACO|nr:hypothetical protein [Companilactobacillus bobalius]KAE9558477.1 hypothetical protein ATN92_13890 [Companilactobacillus bobalius]KRK83752.1 hypothetical protein FC78_GL001334 [Companilactobacillus bobalius DSM 19674]OVE96150.1 hypothetical protein LKACC16343_02448 [Companilactobacillus bobalius]GEO58169.1 hypothetical protein LBO01_12980 [Companilactobacillus paralimentarius]